MLTNNNDIHIINIMNDPESEFNKNLNDDIQNFYEKKNSDFFYNSSSLDINNIPDLGIVFKNVNLSNIDKLDNY